MGVLSVLAPLVLAAGVAGQPLVQGLQGLAGFKSVTLAWSQAGLVPGVRGVGGRVGKVRVDFCENQVTLNLVSDPDT